MQYSLRMYALALLGVFLTLFIALYVSRKAPPEEFYCVFAIRPLVVYEITPDEWNPRVCVNDGPNGEPSLVSVTEAEQRRFEEAGARQAR